LAQHVLCGTTLALEARIAPHSLQSIGEISDKAKGHA
jgi:hypothetical protein